MQKDTSLADELRAVIRGEVDDTPETLEHFSRDASLFVVKPEVVVRPLDEGDVVALMRFVYRHRDDQFRGQRAPLSLTVRAAGTDMSGGPLNASIIIDTTAHLNHCLPIEGDHAVVEPGMLFRDFDARTKQKGLELPSYTASRELNALGGMIANNSGGEKNLAYGKTERYVQELDVVLANGSVATFRALNRDELEAKFKEETFEGDVYRRMASLVRGHAKSIQAARPRVEKNSSGYALWDIGDGENSLNLARLMVGAQGTLGIITRAKLALVHPKPYAAMTVLFVRSISQLGELVPRILAKRPDSFESYDDHTFELAAKYFPEFAAQMKSGIVKLGFQFLPEVLMAASGGVPKLVLLVEFRAESQDVATEAAESLARELRERVRDVSLRVAHTEDEARKYWVVRRESFNLLRKKVRGKRTAPFIDDFVVPPMVLSEFLPKLEATLADYDLTYTIAGHVGDGNFHIIPLMDPTRGDAAQIIDELSHKVYDLVLSYHGSITGEHNDGLIRTPYVKKMFGDDVYALFEETKRIFDPYNLLNPGKKVGLTFDRSMHYLDLPTRN